MSICHFWYFALYKIGMCNRGKEGGGEDGEKNLPSNNFDANKFFFYRLLKEVGYKSCNFTFT